ncbi:MAG TPA: NUDIX hydrolase [Kofleriaceae bacterium]|nr:NUDIX hydrolase [Kofleriaceae bacterium]
MPSPARPRRTTGASLGSRDPVPTWYFALVVVRLGHRFLLTQERRYGATWSVPGGRVEPGETLAAAALREVREETGVPIKLDGVLRVEHSPSERSARIRVIFVGSPLDDTQPKSTPDEESLGAAYLTLDEIRERPLRGAELRVLLETVHGGCQVFPLDLLGSEMSV